MDTYRADYSVIHPHPTELPEQCRHGGVKGLSGKCQGKRFDCGQ